jgi:hypothetical protein
MTLKMIINFINNKLITENNCDKNTKIFTPPFSCLLFLIFIHSILPLLSSSRYEALMLGRLLPVDTRVG